MARLVRHERTEPVKIQPGDLPRDEQGNLKVISLCACGISARYPFCDGAHKSCRTEQPGKLYTYDEATRQVLRVEDDPSGPSPATGA